MKNRNTAVDDHHDHFHLCSMRCVSWPAIIFGSLVAVSLGFLFNIFSISVGLSAFPVTPEGKTEFAVWGFVGLVIIAIFTMFASGWISGFLARSYCYKRSMGELYGFGAWALALVVTMFLASQVNPFLSQKSYLVGRNLTTLQLTNQITNNTNEATNLSQQPTSPETKEAATALGIASFATFFILFIGALSASFGGRLGIKYRKYERVDHCPTCNK
jgi:hypothetical protein